MTRLRKSRQKALHKKEEITPDISGSVAEANKQSCGITQCILKKAG